MAAFPFAFVVTAAVMALAGAWPWQATRPEHDAERLRPPVDGPGTSRSLPSAP